MYDSLLHAHSLIRYFMLLALLVVIIQSILGSANKTPFGKWDDKASLYLLIFTHLQLIVGLILYFVSPWVRFSGGVMGDADSRYWTVEHILGMVIAVTLITVGRIRSKRTSNDLDKRRVLLTFNAIALIVIIVILAIGPRGILAMTRP